MPYKNPEDRRAYVKRWRAANKTYQADWAKQHPGYQEEKSRQWRQRNAARLREYKALLRAGQAAPPWVDRYALLGVYLLAQEFIDAGFSMHVDHIVPLQHPNVCGLHVPWNLRPCTAEGNTKKGNSFPNYFLGKEQGAL